MPSQTRTYYVALPEGVDVQGYSSIDHKGRTEAASPKEAVTHILAREKQRLSDKVEFPGNFIALAMGVLDNEYGGAQHYAFINPEVRIQGVEQNKEDIEQGQRLKPDEKKLLALHDYARRLALENRADLSNPLIRLDYLDRARYLLEEFRKKH